MRNCVWICILLLIVHNSKAQTFAEKKFIHYTTAKGLSDNFITGIVQDGRGFIWVSTDNGLNRLDGNEIQKHFQVPGEESLIKDKLTHLRNAQNALLVSSSKGSQWVDVERNDFINLMVSAD